ncbi:MAG: serine/threonine-protein kinase, partial [Planctomycetota bacterium]
MSDRCPCDDELQRLLHGLLDPYVEQCLTKHLDDCVSCQLRLERIAGPLRRPADPPATLTLDGSLAEAIVFLKEHPPERIDLEHYEIIEEVGRGGMGIVFSAFDRKLERTVAIKLAAHEGANATEFQQRFLRDARAIAAVKHDNIVSIHSVEQSDDQIFLVMELVAGESLAERLQRVQRLSPTNTVGLAIQITDALTVAHRAGICHRDIKPANILLQRPNDRVKVTDFGLAKSGSDPASTAPGLILGTPEYMSPEQACGQTPESTSDLFSLGVVLYEACSGLSPFRAETSVGTLRRIVNHDPPPLKEIAPEVPEWFSRIVARLLSKDPARRFASAEEVSESLRQGEQVRIANATTRPMRYRRGAFVMALTCLAVIAAVFVTYQMSKNPSEATASFEDSSTQRRSSEEFTSGFMVGKQHYSTLLAAISESPPTHGVIRVLGTGPYRVHGFDLETKSITLRGAASRPILLATQADAANALFRADHGITLENLGIDWPRSSDVRESLESYSSGAAIESHGGKIRLLNCDLTTYGQSSGISSRDGSVSLENCRLTSESAPVLLWTPRGNRSLRVKDCVWSSQQAAVGIITYAGDDATAARVELDHNLFQARSVIQATLENRIQQIEFLTRANACDTKWLLLVSRGNSFPGIPRIGDFASIRDHFQWSEEQNMYR